MTSRSRMLLRQPPVVHNHGSTETGSVGGLIGRIVLSDRPGDGLFASDCCGIAAGNPRFNTG